MLIFQKNPYGVSKSNQIELQQNWPTTWTTARNTSAIECENLSGMVRVYGFYCYVWRYDSVIKMNSQSCKPQQAQKGKISELDNDVRKDRTGEEDDRLGLKVRTAQ